MDKESLELAAILNNAISPNSKTRGSAESKIEVLLRTKFEQFCQVACHFLKSNLGVIYFKKAFKNEKTKTTGEFLSKLLSLLIDIAFSKPRRTQKKQISILIGELLLVMDNEKMKIDSTIEEKLWNDLFVLLHALKPTLKEDARRLVQTNGVKLVDAFQKTEESDQELRILIGETIGEMCMTMDGHTLSPFAQFIYGLLSKTVIFEKDASLFDRMLNILADIVENEHMLFEGILDLCLQDLNKIIQLKALDLKQKFAFIDTICTAFCEIEGGSKEREGNIQEKGIKVKLILDGIVDLMIEKQTELGSDWINNEEDDEEKELLQPLDIVDKLLEKFNFCGSLKIISQKVGILYSEGSLKGKKDNLIVALLLLSQVGEYTENILEISPIVNMTQENCIHKDPAVRYVSFHCVGQLSYDLSPQFQQNYGESVISHVIVGINDKVLKVKSHALAALSNFLSGCQLEHIINFIPNIYKVLMESLKVEKYNILKMTLANLKLMANVAKMEMSSYLEPTLNELLTMAQRTKDTEKRNGLEIHMLYVETAACFIKDIPRKGTEKFEVKIMSLLIENKNKVKTFDDPRFSILFDCWISILECISKVGEVPRDQILSLIDTGMKTIIGIQDSEGKSKDELDHVPVDYSVLIKSITLISKIAINQLGSPLPQTEKYIKYCLNSVSNLVNEEVRIQATKALPQLIACIRQSKQDPKKTIIRGLAKVILKVTIFSCTLEISPSVICKKLESMCEMIALMPKQTFTTTEINQTYSVILQILSKVKIETTLVSVVAEGKNPENQTPDEEEKVEPNLLNPGELVYIAVGNLVAALCKFHKTECMSMSFHILTNFSFKILSLPLPKSYSASMQKFALNILVDYLDNYQLHKIEHKEAEIFFFLSRSLQNSHWIVKHAAILGIGSFANGLDRNFLKYTQDTFSALFDAQSQKSNIGEEGLDMMAEVMLITWGYILQLLYKYVQNPREEKIIRDNTDIWLLSLPVDFDHIETKTQYAFLLYLIENYFKSILSFGSIDLECLIKSMIQAYQNPKGTDDINKRVETIFRELSNQQETKKELSEIHERMPRDGKKKMEMCLANGLK